MLEFIVTLIVLLPLSASAWIAGRILFRPNGNRGEANEPATARIAVGSGIAVLGLVLLLDFWVLVQGFPTSSLLLGQWFSSGTYTVSINFLLDGLALEMLNIVALVSLIMTRFSVNYLHRETAFQRFFMVLCLFTTGLLLLALAGNAMLSFVAWEFLGMSSYLLIGYRWQRDAATSSALRAFITNRLGDAMFILSLTFSFFWLKSSDWLVLTAHEGISNLQIGLITIGMTLAALIKSAQFPFSAWISRALEGPTSSSAIFYGSLMVHAGVFLLLRMQPMLAATAAWSFFLFAIGLASVVYGFLGGLVQSDVKTSLIFSVIAQVGLMVMAIALGWIEWAMIHLAVHALWRSYQFLHAPSFLHQTNQPARPVPTWLLRWHGLYTAALHRFWLDLVADWFFTRPIQALARDAHLFEEKVVDRISGRVSEQHRVSSLSQWEKNQIQQQHPQSDAGIGRGFLGYFMQRFANLSQWFEEKLILRVGSHGLLGLLRQLSAYFDVIEGLLVQPRYLMLFILLTFMLVL